MPKVTVIIPNYNHANYLKQRIESVLNQSFQDFELILLDDKSTDNSNEILTSYSDQSNRISYHPNKENSGSPFHQWNKGAQLAKGEYLWIAESDDFCEPELLEELVKLLDKNPNCGIAYTQSYLVSEKGEKINSYLKNLEFIYKSDIWKRDFIKDGREANREWLLFHNPIPNASGALIRRQAFLESGMADTDMKLNGDWFTYAKILSRWDLAFCAEHLNYFRVHEQTQRQRNHANYKIFAEILTLINFIRENTPQSEENANRALTKVSGWWAGSLPYQKWKDVFSEGNKELYKSFKHYKPKLLRGIIIVYLITYLRNILIALGLLKPLKKLRHWLFPGKYFEH